MTTTYKDIVITPFRGNANNDPVIKFSSGDATTNSDMNVRFYATSNGTLSFEGNSGQMFSITNDLTGTIFSVNDISGIPSLEIDANGKVSIAHFGGNVGIGTSNAQYKLDVAGTANITSNLIVQGVDVIPTLIAAFEKANTGVIVVTGTTQSAIKDKRYVLANTSATTVTLPATPTLGDTLYILVANGLSNNVIGRNSSKVMGLDEDMTIDIANTSIGLIYIDTNLGWRII
jgi:hypothetical protein